MSSDDRGRAPLAGVRVLDFSRVLAGPHCGRLLTDLGADVIKVEPPQGDLTRFATIRVNSLATYFIQQNVGKRNISLDLSKPEATELLLRCIPHVDVVLENFRPGVMARMGLGYERLAEHNPRIVYGSISGWGQDGPWRDRPAYAPTVHAEMGWLELDARAAGRTPTHMPFSHADVYSGIHATVGILAALFQREHTGRGQHVDVAMGEVLLSSNEHLASEFVEWREDPHPFDRASPIFRTRGGWVTVSGDPIPRGAFQSWCRAMGRDDLADDPRFGDDAARTAHRGELMHVLQEWILTFDDLPSLEAALQKGRLVLGEVRTITDAASSEWVAARGAVVEVSDRGEGTIKVPNTPWRFSGARSGVHGRPAYRGEHNREVFSELAGASEAELDALEAAEVLSSRGPTAR